MKQYVILLKSYSKNVRCESLWALLCQIWCFGLGTFRMSHSLSVSRVELKMTGFFMFWPIDSSILRASAGRFRQALSRFWSAFITTKYSSFHAYFKYFYCSPAGLHCVERYGLFWWFLLRTFRTTSLCLSRWKWSFLCFWSIELNVFDLLAHTFRVPGRFRLLV